MAYRNELDDNISLFAIGTALIRHWRRTVAMAIIGATIAALAVVNKPRLYASTLAFVPNAPDPTRAGLASLAGQFGLMTAGSNPAQQPEFYYTLVSSRELLGPIMQDTVTVAELGGRRVALLDLLEVKGDSPANRLENGVRKLRNMMGTSIVKPSGIVRVTVRTKWPSASLQISETMLAAINHYNVRTRQSQAAAERRFVEARLSDAKDSLRAAEDRLQTFLATNRSGVEAPHLKSAWQRLEREVSFRASLFAAMTQEYEEVRIREVRDTPTISVFESPSVSTIPEPRRRVFTTALGLLLGAGIGVAVTLAGLGLNRRRERKDPDAAEFFGVITESKDALLRRLPRPRQTQL